MRQGDEKNDHVCGGGETWAGGKVTILDVKMMRWVPSTWPALDGCTDD